MRYLLFSSLPRLSTALAPALALYCVVHWLQFRACTVDGNQSNEKPTELFAFTRRRGRERQTTTYGTADCVCTYGIAETPKGGTNIEATCFFLAAAV